MSAWANVWRDDLLDAGPKRADVAIPMAAHQPEVRVRFHYYTSPDVTAGRWWAIDDVFIGDRRCDAVPGGMVAGRVTDANTADRVSGARIAGPSGATTSDADGWYSMFAPGQGSQAFVGSKLQYHDLKKSVAIAADQVTKSDFRLPTGQIAVAQAVTAAPALGGSGRVPLALTNTGTAPAQVTLAERPGDFQIAGERGQPWSGAGHTAGGRLVVAAGLPDRYPRQRGRRVRQQDLLLRWRVEFVAGPARGRQLRV